MIPQATLGKQAWVFFLILLLSTAVAAEVRVYNLTYDQIGNLKQGFGQYYEYNEFNQLLRVRDNGPTGTILEEYVYDHEGNRLKKYEPQLNQTTYYFSDEYIEVVNTTGTYQYVYYYEGDTLVGREDPDGRKYFYHPDVLGSTDLITNESGGIVEETTYEPHGEVIEGGESSEFLYTTKELDDQTGLYYFGARYYDPFHGKFTEYTRGETK